jgi:hypothetical protein
MQACVLLRGNAFARIVRGWDGQVRELPLSPDRVTVLHVPSGIAYDCTPRAFGICPPGRANGLPNWRDRLMKSVPRSGGKAFPACVPRQVTHRSFSSASG